MDVVEEELVVALDGCAVDDVDCEAGVYNEQGGVVIAESGLLLGV